jgi:hypothetical protein
MRAERTESPLAAEREKPTSLTVTLIDGELPYKDRKRTFKSVSALRHTIAYVTLVLRQWSTQDKERWWKARDEEEWESVEGFDR